MGFFGFRSGIVPCATGVLFVERVKSQVFPFKSTCLSHPFDEFLGNTIYTQNTHKSFRFLLRHALVEFSILPSLSLKKKNNEGSLLPARRTSGEYNNRRQQSSYASPVHLRSRTGPNPRKQKTSACQRKVFTANSALSPINSGSMARTRFPQFLAAFLSVVAALQTKMGQADDTAPGIKMNDPV